MKRRILALLLSFALCLAVTVTASARVTVITGPDGDVVDIVPGTPDPTPAPPTPPYTPSVPTYTVGSGTGSTANGSWSVDRTSASQGTTVTITATPKDGYEVGTVSIKDINGKTVTVTKTADGKYKFTMPAGGVTVDVTFTPKTPTVVFTDVPAGSYYEDAVKWAVENGITQGTSATTFSPNSPCTRGQMVEFLYRAAGSPAVSGSMQFTDVSATAYYRNAVIWAVQNNITQGTSATTFSPDSPCTRAQMVTFLHRSHNEPAATGTNSFADVPANAYYETAVQWAVNEGITEGTSATTFSPDSACTRGQMVTFLYRDMAD